jgi:methyl-accepting chemotaxis protein
MTQGVKDMDRPKQSKQFTISIGIVVGILGGTLAALGLELSGYFLWGVLLHILVLIPGLVGLLVCMRSLRNTLGGKEESPLLRQDTSKFLDSLKTHIAQSGEIREVLRAEIGEREAIASHIKNIVEEIFAHFKEIEVLVTHGIEVLNSIETYISSLEEAVAGQTKEINTVEIHISEVAEAVASLAGRIRESAGEAENIQEIISAGETQVLAVNTAIKEISQHVKTITELAVTINKISAQTNILSMNAAIESAHAGVAGVGFAVVADEIRTLSELTRENAKNIQSALSAITQKTADALKTSDASANKLNGITTTIGDFSRSLSALNQEVQENGAIDKGVDYSIGNQKDLNETIKNGSKDIIAYNQNFRGAMENVLLLTDKTRAEIKEIQSGTREVLDHIKKSEQCFLKNIEETVAISAVIPPPGEFEK